MSAISEEINQLLQEQLQEWDLARGNFEALSKVETKEFAFDGFVVRVQFNPARIQSTAAKVDTKSIQERKCFLCSANLPAVQRSVPYGTKYQLLVNPFPIFPRHFTIPDNQHLDQLIFDRFGDMLDLAQSIDDCTLFYNGPKCGASAPDHIHFQAGNKGFMPIEEEMKNINKELIHSESNLQVFALRNYLRNGFLIQSKDKESAVHFFKQLYAKLEIKDGEKEPMLNLLAWYEDETWYSCIFPRENHRPTCFYAEGDENILISPASVDMGGVFITPQEKDFNKITAENIAQILKEVCITDEKLNQIIQSIKE